jgi:hypothetical protein
MAIFRHRFAGTVPPLSQAAPIVQGRAVTLVHCRHLSAEIISDDGLPNSGARALLGAGDLNCQTQRGSGLGRS